MKQKLRLGFVGCGGIAQVHMKNFVNNNQAEIVAFCDKNEIAAKKANQQFGSQTSKVFTLAENMFDKIELDAVYFCLPPFEHGSEYEAIKRNIPFFVEKPINLDLHQAKEIARKVKENQLLTSVGYMNRYRKGVNKARELLKNDTPILVLGGIIDMGICQRASPNSLTWWFRKEKSGGQLYEETSHTIDLARFLCGEVKSVHAYAADEIESLSLPVGSNIEVASVVNLKFANNAVGNIWSMFLADGQGEEISLTVHTGKIIASFLNWDHSFRLTRNGKIVEEILSEPNIFEIEDSAFIEAILTENRSKIMSSYEDGLKTIKITHAANESMKTGKSVRLLLDE